MPFESFKGEQFSALQRERQNRRQSTALARYVYADVVFTAPDTDVDIPLGDLNPSTAQSVRWIPVMLTAAAVVYQDQSGTAKASTPTHLWLRASAACTARLLLFTEPNAAA